MSLRLSKLPVNSYISDYEVKIRKALIVALVLNQLRKLIYLPTRVQGIYRLLDGIFSYKNMWAVKLHVLVNEEFLFNVVRCRGRHQRLYTSANEIIRFCK